MARASRRMVAAASVLVVLTLGVFEPLLCLVHCALWQHAMQHRTANAVSPALFGSVNFLCSLPDTSAARRTSYAANAPSNGANSMASGSAPAPLAQPQPFHEMLLLVVASLVIVRAVRWPRLLALHAPAQRFIAPPHQPPMVAATFFF